MASVAQREAAHLKPSREWKCGGYEPAVVRTKDGEQVAIPVGRRVRVVDENDGAHSELGDENLEGW